MYRYIYLLEQYGSCHWTTSLASLAPCQHIHVGVVALSVVGNVAKHFIETKARDAYNDRLREDMSRHMTPSQVNAQMAREIQRQAYVDALAP